LNKPSAKAAKIELLTSDNDDPLHYQVRRSQRAKKTRIVVTAEKIEVVAPFEVSEHRIRAFVARQQGWIKDAVNRIQYRAQTAQTLAPARYVEGVTVPYLGKQIPLTIKSSLSKHLKLQLESDRQFIAYIPEQLRENSSDRIRQALETWMRQQIRQHANQLIAKHSGKHQLIPRCIRIKTQKTRWGSCGPKNDINLNWLLMLAPPIVLEYVVVHELCHIKHKNHSKDFWLLVKDHMPDYLIHRHWLKQHGASLMRGL